MKGMTPICPYCGQFSEKEGGAAIYPHRPDLYPKTFYQCAPCGAYVGTHSGTDQPLGRLADADLRQWKQMAHAVFDPIWRRRFERKSIHDPRYKKGMARGGRYKRLAELMGIPKEDCHIGMFDIAACKQAIETCQSGALED